MPAQQLRSESVTLRPIEEATVPAEAVGLFWADKLACATPLYDWENLWGPISSDSLRERLRTAQRAATENAGQFAVALTCLIQRTGATYVDANVMNRHFAEAAEAAGIDRATLDYLLQSEEFVEQNSATIIEADGTVWKWPKSRDGPIVALWPPEATGQTRAEWQRTQDAAASQPTKACGVHAKIDPFAVEESQDGRVVYRLEPDGEPFYL